MTVLHTAGADPGFDQGGAPDRDRPKTAILGPQFCRILVLGPHFWWSGGGPGPRGPPPGSAPVQHESVTYTGGQTHQTHKISSCIHFGSTTHLLSFDVSLCD